MVNQLSFGSSGINSQADFSPLAQLGDVYRQGQARQVISQLQRKPDGSFDTSPLFASGDMNLAKLGMELERNKSLEGRDTRDFAFRQTEAQRAQQNADRSYGLQERAQTRLEQTPEETATERAKAAIAQGVTPQDPRFKPFVLTGKLPEQDTTFSTTIEQRKQAAIANGLAPDSPGFQSYVLTGKMPREDAQPLTSTDKKAILEADEAVATNQAAIDSLKRAKALSKEAYSGLGAGVRGAAASFLGPTSDTGKAGIATENLTNEVTSNALGQLKAIFGGAPTEGERKILLDIQGSVGKPDAVRQEIYERAQRAAEKRLEFNRKRADEMRGGTYYKPAGATRPTLVAPPAAGTVKDGYRFKGGNPGDPASWEKVAP